MTDNPHELTIENSALSNWLNGSIHPQLRTIEELQRGLGR